MLRSTIRVGLVWVGLWGCASGPKDAETAPAASETAPPPVSTPAPEASAAPAPVSDGNLYGTEVEPPTGGLGISGTGSESGPKRIRIDSATVNGRLPADVIRGVVRKNFGVLRVCYEGGLGRDPTLDGLVVTRFVIERDGSVSNVDTSKSEIADPEVVTCVGAAFETLRFPEPEGGIVRVTYPIRFSPG